MSREMLVWDGLSALMTDEVRATLTTVDPTSNPKHHNYLATAPIVGTCMRCARAIYRRGQVDINDTPLAFNAVIGSDGDGAAHTCLSGGDLNDPAYPRFVRGVWHEQGNDRDPHGPLAPARSLSLTNPARIDLAGLTHPSDLTLTRLAGHCARCGAPVERTASATYDPKPAGSVLRMPTQRHSCSRDLRGPGGYQPPVHVFGQWCTDDASIVSAVFRVFQESTTRSPLRPGERSPLYAAGLMDPIVLPNGTLKARCARCGVDVLRQGLTTFAAGVLHTCPSDQQGLLDIGQHSTGEWVETHDELTAAMKREDERQRVVAAREAYRHTSVRGKRVESPTYDDEQLARAMTDARSGVRRIRDARKAMTPPKLTDDAFGMARAAHTAIDAAIGLAEKGQFVEAQALLINAGAFTAWALDAVVAQTIAARAKQMTPTDRVFAASKLMLEANSVKLANAAREVLRRALDAVSANGATPPPIEHPGLRYYSVVAVGESFAYCRHLVDRGAAPASGMLCGVINGGRVHERVVHESELSNVDRLCGGCHRVATERIVAASAPATPPVEYWLLSDGPTRRHLAERDPARVDHIKQSTLCGVTAAGRAAFGPRAVPELIGNGDICRECLGLAIDRRART